MTPQVKQTFVISFLFLGLTLVLFYAGFLFQEKTDILHQKNQHHQRLLDQIKTIHFPEQFISLLKEHEDAKNVEELLKQSAKTHYISFDNLKSSLNKKDFQTIEVTFSAELDTDIFHYIETLKDHYKNTLALQEIGVFRGETGVTGKMVFKIFTPHNVATGYSNE